MSDRGYYHPGSIVDTSHAGFMRVHEFAEAQPRHQQPKYYIGNTAIIGNNQEYYFPGTDGCIYKATATFHPDADLPYYTHDCPPTAERVG